MGVIGEQIKQNMAYMKKASIGTQKNSKHRHQYVFTKY